MASVIKIKRSTTPGTAPSSLSAGEIAINIPDRKLFVGDGSSIYHIGGQYLSVANAAATYQTISTERAALANTNAYIATRASWTALTGTNTALRTLISDRYQVANVNTLLAAKATWVALTGTNTALRTLISDRLQVANAAATYQTIATERAALANTNAYIATKVSSASPSTTGFFNHTGRLSVGTNLNVSGNTVIDGNLTVEGAVTYISSSTLNVDDSMIKLAANNAADSVDVGLYGKYVSSGTKYSGLFRDASDGIWKFYTGSQTEPTTTVDTGATGYAVATIEATIDGGTY